MQESVRTPTHGRNVFLDGLRGISALVVVVYHVGHTGAPPHGNLAVDFFFMLSGFVIAGAYEDKLRQGGTPSWFFSVRMARLYPLAVFGVLLGAISVYLNYPPQPLLARIGALVRGLLFLPSTTGDRLDPAYGLNPVMWSLAAELAVNMLYAWGGWRLSNRALVGVMVVAALSLTALALSTGHTDLGAFSSVLDLAGATARVLFGFSLGVLLWRLKRSGWKPETTFSTPVLVLLLLLVYEVPTRADLPVDLLLSLVVLPLLFVLMLGARAPEGRTASAFAWMGGLSYAVYVVHFPIAWAFHLTDGPAPAPVMFVLGLGLVALAALFGHYVIEPWGKNLIERRFRPIAAVR